MYGDHFGSEQVESISSTQRVHYHANSTLVAAVSQASPVWMDILQTGYNDDAHAQKLISELSVTATHSNQEGFTLSDGLLRYHGRI
jgi:hypothetical protein